MNMKNIRWLTRARWQWRLRHDPECFRGLAYTFWRLLLIALLVSSVFSVGFGAWFFIQEAPSSTESDVVQDTKKRTETLSREQLKSTLATYKQRELNFEKLQKVIDTAPDPSR